MLTYLNVIGLKINPAMVQRLPNLYTPTTVVMY
jgi:hypothetical protein